MSGLRTISKLGRDRTKLGLPYPWAALAGSLHDPEGSSGNLGHIAGLGPQDYNNNNIIKDYLGFSRPKL